MKKLLSFVLALIMMASMAVYLPLGISATETEAAPVVETIYAENFDALTNGTYTAEKLGAMLGWTLLRGNPDAVVATVTDGVLRLESESGTDLLYQIATDVRLMENHTMEYDLTMVGGKQGLAYNDYKLFFSAIYSGTYNAASGVTRAVLPKFTYEGFHHMALVDGVINEQNIYAPGYLIAGTSQEQCRPENVPFGGGLNKPNTKTTVKNIFDLTRNQVDCLASNARINSTASSLDFEAFEIADYASRYAFLRVQKGLVAEYDNINITTVGDADVKTSNVVFEQNFDDIVYDPETDTPETLQQKTGMYSFTVSHGQDPSETDLPEDAPEGAVGNPIKVDTTYSIVDGKLDILNPYGASTVEPKLYIPEMEKGETVVVEFDQQMVYFDILGEYDRGDQAVEFQMFGLSSVNRIWLRYTQKGFPTMKFYGSAGDVTVGQLRPQTINYNNRVSGHKYSDHTDSHYNLYKSYDHHKFVFSIEHGVEWYINGALTMYLNEAQLAKWQGENIMGSLLKFYIPAGCHVQYDNFKVVVDPEDVRPDLIITEAASSAFGDDSFEYVEVYNNSDEPVNVYDYSLVTQTIATSMNHSVNTDPADVITLYPGEHTYKSIAKDAKTGESLYSVTHTNPAYAEGWLQPGEVALIWNTADAMHTGSAAKPIANKTQWKYTVEDFRRGTAAIDDVKVFMAYNDYNRSFDNEGRYLLALADRTVYQPKYQPAYDRGDQTFVEVINSYEHFESYVYMLIAGPFDPADNRNDFGDNMTNNDEGFAAYPSNSNYCYRNFFSDSLSEKTGAPETFLAAQFEYAGNNLSREGLCIDYPNMETRFDVSPGVVYKRQQREVEYTVDEYVGTRFLGTKVYFDICDPTDGKSTLYYFVNGNICFEPMTMRLTEDTVINRVGANIFTLKGAALKLNGTATSLRWTTAIDMSDFDDILSYGDVNLYQSVEIGTLVAKTADLTDGVTLTVENATEDGKVKKVGARTEKWFNGCYSFKNNYYLIKAEMEVAAEDYGTEYSAVGYITVTMMDGTVLTIYGGYNEASHARSVHEVALAIRDDGYKGYDQAKIDALLPVTE